MPWGRRKAAITSAKLFTRCDIEDRTIMALHSIKR